MVYENYSVYGPYIRKDGRLVVILTLHNDSGKICSRKTVSYPKFLVEVALDKYLDKDDTVDHIDGNFLNNDLSNLRIVKRSEHARSHCISRCEVTKHCVVCNKEFTTTRNELITCGSKCCVGKLAHINGYNKGNPYKPGKETYVSNRYTLDHIQPVSEHRVSDRKVNFVKKRDS